MDPRTEPRDTSELCVRCGLCCCVLRAHCSEKDARDLAQTMGVDVRRFAAPPKEDSEHLLGPDGVTIIRDTQDEPLWLMYFPCIFLRGRPMKAVGCAAYSVVDGTTGERRDPRPLVCRSYLCKIAIMYRLGEVTLDDALRLLRVSFDQGDVTIFNWCGSPRDITISRLADVQDQIQGMRQEGMEEPWVDFYAASRLTPRWYPRSEPEHDLLSIHFEVFRQKGVILEHFADPRDIMEWSPEFRAGFAEGIRAVMSDLSELMTNEVVETGEIRDALERAQASSPSGPSELPSESSPSEPPPSEGPVVEPPRTREDSQDD